MITYKKNIITTLKKTAILNMSCTFIGIVCFFILSLVYIFSFNFVNLKRTVKRAEFTVFNYSLY